MNHSQELPQERDWPKAKSVSVPTFRHRNSLDSLLQQAGFEQQGQGDKIDAFLLYSNDEVRMRTISSGLLGADQESTSTEDHTIRKTRMSFEVHPSVFCEDFLLADANADNSLHGDSLTTLARKMLPKP